MTIDPTPTQAQARTPSAAGAASAPEGIDREKQKRASDVLVALGVSTPAIEAEGLVTTLQQAGAGAQCAVDHEAFRAAAADSGVTASDEDQVADMREAAVLLVGAADWIMREVVHQENRIGQEQTHARNMARAVRGQAKRLLASLPATSPAADGVDR